MGAEQISFLGNLRWRNMALDENEYYYEATSVAGVLQQLAACHLRDGYHFYVSGEVREGKDPHEVDEAILTRYGIRISKYKRARRKKLGLANLHYLRFGRRFLQGLRIEFACKFRLFS